MGTFTRLLHSYGGMLRTNSICLAPRMPSADCRHISGLRQLAGPARRRLFGSGGWPYASLSLLLSVVFSVATAHPAAAAPAAPPPLPSHIDFNKHIRPILAENCLLCHGPDKGTRKAGLRLDDRDAALKGVKGRPSIVPGNSAASELVKRVTSHDPDYAMPARDSGRTLTPRQIALFQQWVDEGAKYEPHWSYVTPKKQTPPTVRNTAWVGNPVDQFILAELENEELEPSPEADRRTLIRRLSFDLLGLPPSAKEVEAFVADPSPRAYEQLVDRLLTSPHYGERMAQYWLDLVRFADTVGYHGDQNVDVWPYRDYVIRAFNDNMPFDQFTREQLAGDLLTNATTQQKVASAYNRLNMVTREGGAQAKEYLSKYAADRVRTTSSVWMASTLGCAQCHDHKFDPFTSKDFYSFAAFFADVKEEGVYTSSGFYDTFPPVIRVPMDKDVQKLTELAARVSAAAKEEARLRQLSTNLHSGFVAAAAANLPVKHVSREGGASPSETGTATTAQAGSETVAPALAEARKQVATILGLTPEGLATALADWETGARERLRSTNLQEVVVVIEDDVRGGKKEDQWRLVAKAHGKPTHSGKRVREQSGDGVVQHFATDFAKPQKLRKDDRIYAYVYLNPKKLPSTLMLQIDTGGSRWLHRAYWGKDLIPFGEIGKDTADHHRMGDAPAAGEWVRLEVPLDAVSLKPGEEIHGLAFTQYGGEAWWDDAGVRSSDLPAAPVIAVLKQDASLWTERDRQTLLAGFFDERGLQLAEARHLAARHESEEFEKTLPFCVVTEAVEPRQMRLLPRGNWMDDSGEIVQPAVPRSLPQPLSEGNRRLTRLDLANWLVARDNPLTARVFVNRLWKTCFGTGLSKVLDDLGTRGEWPRHLELLDWLAVEFMDSHWDVKRMVRLLVMSSTYRQSSKPTEKLKEADPFNRLYARQSRWRLDAEFVRDDALEISGLLTTKVGGPSAKPYQPSDYYKELNFPKRTYTPDHGEDQYRRGLYTHWQRTFIHPSLAAFDAPSREECTAERTTSNTPLQALSLLNDPTYLEAARVFAEHMMEHGGDAFADRLRWAYHTAVSRDPTSDEAASIKTLFDEHLVHFKAEPKAAKEFVQVGYAPVPDKIDTAELAAWTSVGRAILNLHETIVRY